jgi:hypothetical protein
VNAVENSTPSTLRAVTHEMGGALGFYGFSTASSDLLEFSRTLSESEAMAQTFFEESQSIFLTQLKRELRIIEGDVNG